LPGRYEKKKDAASQDSRLLGEDLKTTNSNNTHIYFFFVKEIKIVPKKYE